MNARSIPALALGLLLILQLTSAAVARDDAWRSERVSPATSYYMPEIRISEPVPGNQPSRGFPQVVYNSIQREYLVVWQDVNAAGVSHTYARRMTRTGGLNTSSFAVAPGAHMSRSPAVAYNALNGEYLVVYEYDASGDGVHWEVWGRLVSWNGQLGPDFQIFTWANRAFFDPRVAWNSVRNQYMVVASAFDTTTYKFNDVAGRRVMADGSTPYPGGNISSQSQTWQPCEADITYNMAADEYMVVWRRRYSDSDWDIWGARVRGVNGTVVNPPGEDDLDDSGVDQARPAVATNGQDRYLVVWQEATSPSPAADSNIKGLELDVAGIPAVPFLYEYANSTDIEGYPDVVNWDPDTGVRFVVYWRYFAGSQVETWGSTYGPHGMSRFQIGPDAAVDGPVVAAGYPGYLIVYSKVVSGVPTIYGRLYGLPTVSLPLILR